MKITNKLDDKLQNRLKNNSLRSLDTSSHSKMTDFSSNDYLGLANSEVIFDNVNQYLLKNDIKINGATGSRLLSGNHSLYTTIEKRLNEQHHSPASIVFNSGYTANLGLLSTIPQRDDIILYDKLSHASIRDGIRLSHAKAYPFAHNDLKQLEYRLKQYKTETTNNSRKIYVITESVFSMDGDSPNLVTMQDLCQQYLAHLIVDEAHALGLYPYGLVQTLNLHKVVFARIVTFGKALGCHGAVILGSKKLINYLINFSRPFIYTTALSPHAIATILMAYDQLQHVKVEQLIDNINYFKTLTEELMLTDFFIDSNSAIQSCIIPDNSRVRSIALKLQHHNFNVKAILSPTVEQNQQRLRFCVHSFNSKDEIKQVLTLLAKIVYKIRKRS